MTNQANVIEINGWSVETMSNQEPETHVLTGELPFHPVADIFPLMTGQALEDLKADIREHGLREPIWIHDGQIVDGRNRYLACQEVGEPIRSRNWSGGEDLVDFVVSLNLHRRHLNESQRGMVGAKIANMPLGGDFYVGKSNKSTGGEKSPPVKVSNQKAAEMMNVGPDQVKRGKLVLREGIPELAQAVEKGDANLFSAKDVAKLPETEQRAAVADGKKGIREAAKRAREQKKQDKQEVSLEPEETKPGTERNVIDFPVTFTPSQSLEEYEREMKEKMKLVSKEFKAALRDLKAVIKKEKKEGWVNSPRDGVLTHLQKLVAWAATR